VQWCQNGDFLRAVFPASRVQHISHTNFVTFCSPPTNNAKALKIHISQTGYIDSIKEHALGSTYPCPIFSSLVYLRFGSPTETIVRNFSSISTSVIFFFFGSSWLLFFAKPSAGVSIGFVYFKHAHTHARTYIYMYIHPFS